MNLFWRNKSVCWLNQSPNLGRFLISLSDLTEFTVTLNIPLPLHNSSPLPFVCFGATPVVLRSTPDCTQNSGRTQGYMWGQKLNLSQDKCPTPLYYCCSLSIFLLRSLHLHLLIFPYPDRPVHLWSFTFNLSQGNICHIFLICLLQAASQLGSCFRLYATNFVSLHLPVMEQLSIALKWSQALGIISIQVL